MFVSSFQAQLETLLTPNPARFAFRLGQRILMCLTVACLVILNSGCSSKKNQTSILPISPTQKLHRAIFSQDPERVAYALSKGANVNAMIVASEHRAPAVEMSTLRSTPLNAVIADYKYQDSLFVAPLNPGTTATDRSLEIIRLLIKAGLNFNIKQYIYEDTGGNTGGQLSSFEIGGARLAIAMPALIDAGFKPSLNDIQMAFTHYATFEKVMQRNADFFSYFLELEQEHGRALPKTLRQYIAKYKVQLNEEQAAQRARDEEAKAQALRHSGMKHFAMQYKTDEPFTAGQKVCLFKDYEVTVAFLTEISASSSKVKPIYLYDYDNKGIDRETKKRPLQNELTVHPSDLSLCPFDAL